MLQLIADVQKVELVGGESWLGHISVALAAVVAASLAALVSLLNRRIELRHDREMRNRDHIRETLDSIYVEAGQAMKRVSEFLGVVHGTEAWRDGVSNELSDSALEAVDHELEEKRNAAYAAILNLAPATGRLEMRLGNEHVIAVCHRKLRLALKAFYDQAPESLKENRSKKARDADERIGNEIRDAHNDFREACFAWINE